MGTCPQHAVLHLSSLTPHLLLVMQRAALDKAESKRTKAEAKQKEHKAKFNDSQGDDEKAYIAQSTTREGAAAPAGALPEPGFALFPPATSSTTPTRVCIPLSLARSRPRGDSMCYVHGLSAGECDRDSSCARCG